MANPKSFLAKKDNALSSVDDNPLSSGATTINLPTGKGALFPATADGYWIATIWDKATYPFPGDDTNMEKVLVTSRSSDALTVVRGYDGTSGVSHAQGSALALLDVRAWHDEYEAAMLQSKENILKNGNFINNSSNGYGGLADDWVDDGNANPVQGGVPSLTKAELISILGVTDGQIEGLWNLDEASGDATDLSSNGYDLMDNNTVGSSQDGLMDRARDFESGNSEYLSISNASCPNLEIVGSQTWIIFVKMESLTAMTVMSKHNGTNYRVIDIAASGGISAYFSGLTGASSISSDAKLEAGKWYMLVWLYDSSAGKLKLWINGVKKQKSGVSGTSSANNGNFQISAYNGSNSPFDGLMQNAIILSTALSDDQVKRLFASTLYKGIKLRRATSDGYIYQTLPQNLVERLRGKDIAITAKMYQDTASIAQVSIDDGTTETESDANATTDEWLEIGATQTIDADATDITLSAKVSDSDGNAWFKEIQVYEGSVLVYTWNPKQPDTVKIRRIDSDYGITEQESIILTGWGYIAGAAGDRINETVTFGLTFSELPIVIANSIGKTLATIYDIGDIDGVANTINVTHPRAITTTSFNLNIEASNSNALNDGAKYGYSWIAIGQLT